MVAIALLVEFLQLGQSHGKSWHGLVGEEIDQVFVELPESIRRYQLNEGGALFGADVKMIGTFLGHSTIRIDAFKEQFSRWLCRVFVDFELLR